jgi:hypothetical protein
MRGGVYIKTTKNAVTVTKRKVNQRHQEMHNLSIIQAIDCQVTFTSNDSVTRMIFIIQRVPKETNQMLLPYYVESQWQRSTQYV